MMVTLYKLYLRHILRYPERIVLGLFNAILWTIILVFFAQAFTSSSIAKAFGLTAMILLSFVSQALRDVGFFFREQEYYGTFYRIFATPASRILLIMTYSLVSFTILALETLIVLSAGRLIGVHIIPGAKFRYSAFVVWLTTFSFSLLVSPIGIFAKNVSGPIINLLQTIIYLLTGVFFPLSLLPPILQKVAYILPFTKAFETFRGATIYSRSRHELLRHSAEPVAISIVLLLAGMLIIKYAELVAMRYGYERL